MRSVPRGSGAGRLDRVPPSDPFRINIGHRSDIAYWTMVLGTTEEALHNAVNRVGRDVEDVALYLRGMRY
jgi:hypothetical protein